MLQVIVVERLDENPLTVCERALIDDDADAGNRTRTIVEKHNERSVVQAEGALVWGVENSSGTFEFRTGESSWRKKQYPDTFNLHGSYVCESGAKYKY
jgi:hypothetical protein